MAELSDIIHAALDVLKDEPGLAEIEDWQEVNRFIPLKSPGISVGAEKETFTAYDRRFDNTEVSLKIYVWVNDSDPARGESEVRRFARLVRYALVKDPYLDGLIDSGFVSEIKYSASDQGQEMLTYLAGMDYQVSCLTQRTEREPAWEVGEVQVEIHH